MTKHLNEFDKQATTKLANVILKHSNLSNQFKDIFEEIEEKLLDDNGEESLKANGIIYSKYLAIQNGEFATILEDNLTDSQKNYLLSLTKENSLVFNIARKNNYLNMVSAIFYVPTKIYDRHSPSFTFSISLSTNLNASETYEIDAYELGIEKEDFYKFVTSYALKYE